MFAWQAMQGCAELLVIGVIFGPFAKCRTWRDVVGQFFRLRQLEQLGVIFATFLVIGAIVNLAILAAHSVWP